MYKNANFTVMICLLFLFVTGIQAAVKNDSTLNSAALGVHTEKVDIKTYAKVFYVSLDAGNNKKGDGSKDSPWQTIDYALSQAMPDLSKKERLAVLVSAGIYDQGTLIMKEFVDLYGGFHSKSWDRDVYKYRSVLDGQGVRRVVVAANNVRLDGFTVSNGLSHNAGAGILCDDTSPMLTNNFVVNNHVIEPADFNNTRIHQEGNNGGGIACLYNGVPLIRNNIFYNNRTSIGTGAAMSFYGWVRHKGSPTMPVKDNRLTGGLRARVENNVIINNTSGINDIYRTRSSSGGGISCAFEARPVIQNNLVALNQAKGRSDAGGIYCEYFASPLVNGNWLLGNIADDDGGGFYTMKMGEPLLTNNFFAGNYTTGGGVGGIRLSKEGRARITDNIVVYNPGGGIMCVDAYMELENNIIMNNPRGSGLKYVQNYSYFMPPVIAGNIIKGNEMGEVVVLENVGHDLGSIIKEVEQPDATGAKSINGKILQLKFDPALYSTEITVDKNISSAGDLSGRVIRIADQWSMVMQSVDNRIIVWGELTAKPESDFEIISDFM
jgi:Protein of unknown function (DUF1565)/Right handed beta helix region